MIDKQPGINFYSFLNFFSWVNLQEKIAHQVLTIFNINVIHFDAVFGSQLDY